MAQHKEFVTASLCKMGQETVQEIVSRTQDVFGQLKNLQLPNAMQLNTSLSNEKKAKIQEGLKSVKLHFKRLRFIYNRCLEGTSGIEQSPLQLLLPIKGTSISDQKAVENYKLTDVYLQVTEEYKEIMEQIISRNRHLKELIDHMRSIVWEINTMLLMRNL